MSSGSKLIAIGDDAQTSNAEVQDNSAKGAGSALPQQGPDDHIGNSSEDPFANWDAEWNAEAKTPDRDWGWLTPILSCLVIIGWSGFFVWTNYREMMAGAQPSQWIDWIGAWAVPVLLVLAVWLLAMRNSRREGKRFSDVAANLSRESAQLETRLATINRELSLAREFLAAQSRELESLGRTAGERLSEHADHLKSLVRSNGEQVDAIASVSTTALENMEKLRDDLPVVANSARDVSNQIGSAGRTANGQVSEMIGGFERLNEFGAASERWTQSLQEKIAETLAGFDGQLAKLDAMVTDRFAAFQERSTSFEDEIDMREEAALVAMRGRSAKLTQELGNARTSLDEEEAQAVASFGARLSGLRDEAAAVGSSLREEEDTALARLGEAMDNMQARLSEAVAALSRIDEQALASSHAKLQSLLTEAEVADEKLADREVWFRRSIEDRRNQLDADESAALETLQTRFAMFGDAIATRNAELHDSAEAFSTRGEAITAKLAEFRGEIAILAEQGGDTERLLSASVEELSAKLAESRNALGDTGSQIDALTEASVRLLELVRGAAERSRDDLPASMDEAERRLHELCNNVREMHELLDDAAIKGHSLSNYVIASKNDGQDAADAITTLHARLAEAGTHHADKLQQLRVSVEQLGQESDDVSQRALTNLRAAVAVLEDAVAASASNLAETTEHNIQDFATKVGNQTADAVDKALRQCTEEAVLQLEDRTANAANVSREATIQLRDQLAKVNELTGNLETRVNRARERAEEQVDNDFSRRVALISESLNSNAIDISKGLSSEVSDIAWASYLRGDRGIFTRRAVSLLDNTEARDIAEVYDSDPDFREHVSRYIHDFEAMLRTMLSTRDGNALSVTLLSSDMGKLYVALAQATERLRA